MRAVLFFGQSPFFVNVSHRNSERRLVLLIQPLLEAHARLRPYAIWVNVILKTFSFPGYYHADCYQIFYRQLQCSLDFIVEAVTSSLRNSADAFGGHCGLIHAQVVQLSILQLKVSDVPVTFPC